MHRKDVASINPLGASCATCPLAGASYREKRRVQNHPQNLSPSKSIPSSSVYTPPPTLQHHWMPFISMFNQINTNSAKTASCLKTWLDEKNVFINSSKKKEKENHYVILLVLTTLQKTHLSILKAQNKLSLLHFYKLSLDYDCIAMSCLIQWNTFTKIRKKYEIKHMRKLVFQFLSKFTCRKQTSEQRSCQSGLKVNNRLLLSLICSYWGSEFTTSSSSSSSSDSMIVSTKRHFMQTVQQVDREAKRPAPYM